MKNDCLIKTIALVIILLLIGRILFPNIIKGSKLNRMIYVDDDNINGPWDGSREYPYQYIYEAVKVSQDGDSIYVFNGTYQESLTIEKTIKLIGEKKETTTIVLDRWWSKISIKKENVTIQSFTIKKDENSTENLSGGIIITANSTIIRDNIFINTTNGIYINSKKNIIIDNTFILDGIYIGFDSKNNIIKNNKVNGKNLVYLEGESNKSIDFNAGQVILIDCNNITVENQVLTDSCIGVQLIRTNYSYIKKNIIRSNHNDGLLLDDSYWNNISNNDISYNDFHGLSVDRYSDSNNIIDNIISENFYGINLYGSSFNNIKNNEITKNYRGISCSFGPYKNIISDNIISDNREGITLSDRSSNNIISFNVFSNNTYSGISIGHYSSYKIFFSNNTISNNFFYDDGLLLLDSRVQTVSNNIVNGKPLVYLDGVSNKVIENAGQVILIECDKITIKEQDLTNTIISIQLLETDHCDIYRNNISSNHLKGLWVYRSDSNIISHNTIVDNTNDGIYLEQSNRNYISENEINNNEYGIRFYDGIEWGFEFPETSISNKITSNNIRDNKQEDAYFHNSIFNQWNRNYWGNQQPFHLINGRIYLQRGWHFGSPPKIDLPIFLFDLYPSKKPYEIL